MRRALLAAALILSGAPDSRGEPGPAPPDLRARRLPFLPRLAMRTAAAPAPAGPAAPVAPRAPTPPSGDPLRFERSSPRPPTDPTARERFAQLAEQVRAQLTLGFAVDGAAPSSRARTVAGRTLVPPDGSIDRDTYLAQLGYARARAYAFGDAMLGVDGVGAPGVSIYLASQFRVTPERPTFAPVATAWDRADDLHIRAGWAEADGVFDRGLLAPLVLRGGRQFVYGATIAHLDGLWAGWRRGGLAASAYLGARVPAWFEADARFPAATPRRGLVSGGEVQLDLRRFALPLQVRLRMLAFDNHGHSDATVDWWARKDLIATATARLFDGELVREHVTVRYRVSDETSLTIDGDARQRSHPAWDHELLAFDDTEVARRYLDLGPTVPRVAARARAGTVILDNVDVLLHGGFALDARVRADEVSYQAAGWVEGGAAFEVRVRRAVALGLSGLARTYRRRDPQVATDDVEDVVQPLELQPRNLGERNLFEGGVSLRISGGARRFSTMAEIYARRTKFAERYRNQAVSPAGPPGLGDDEAGGVLTQVDQRGGGRFSVEAWITPYLRMRVEYDLSSELDLAPEVRGLKALRVLAEGTF